MPSRDINHVVLTGRLTSDPDLRTFPSGSVCELRVAVNARRREETGEWVEKPNFFDVVVYGTSGENVAKHMHKGGPVAVAGRLDWREWETKDGRHAQAVRIVARNVQFLSGAPSSNGNNSHVDDGAGGLHGIATEDQELLDLADQNMTAMTAAERY
jgi:single-strand DNA-binding protein